MKKKLKRRLWSRRQINPEREKQVREFIISILVPGYDLKIFNSNSYAMVDGRSSALT